MRFYILSASERLKIEEFNKGRKNTLLVICDHGEGYVGVDGDDFESPEFQEWLTDLKTALEPTRMKTLSKEDLESTGKVL